MSNELQEMMATFSCRDGFEMGAWSVRPADTQQLPGILFIYEPFGINPEMKRVASEIAHDGYVVMIPDLMQRGSFFSCIRQLMADMKAERGRTIDDLFDARAHLVARGDVIQDRVAVVGLCMGGGFALILAKSGLFRVSAPFYGQAPLTMTDACPVIASYGGRDAMTRNSAARLAEALALSDIENDFKIYPEAGHSFMTHAPNHVMAVLGSILPGRAAFNADAAKDATKRLLDFLHAHL
jgi:carboxymethylenebutenolidase